MLTFNDLIFNDHFGGINASHAFDNGWAISVSAGKMPYSTPRENHQHAHNYSSFEVAVFNPQGEFAINEILKDKLWDVAGWQGRDDIDNIIEVISNI
jgi:hypothetical protein